MLIQHDHNFIRSVMKVNHFSRQKFVDHIQQTKRVLVIIYNNFMLFLRCKFLGLPIFVSHTS